MSPAIKVYYNIKQCTFFSLGIYPCSDIPFVRSTSIAASPDLVDRAWEEYMTDSFQLNPDIVVKCKGEIIFLIVIFNNVLSRHLCQ